MPISYSIDREMGVIFELWEGDISKKDLAEYWSTFLSDPEVLTIRKTVADIRKATPMFNGDDLSDLIHAIVHPAIDGLSWKTALVVENPHQFGVSRQYQVFAARYSQDAIFKDQASALQWLMQK
ncbi:hypothetical protein GMLC_05470 [Geomonas limicola]|uniref:STAS/SEC14 domain-containing protein n=2 Tax=Geomonas limicola TaxID=2740186 RepID=A0A6V8N353_9BACT|nr:hypothetical protein GMLC_05470 [Geomonas limicola]